MSDPRISDPHVLDQPWRIWASIVVIGILLFGVALGVLIIPVVQGRSAGIDMYTAICRALGILPGSPAQPQPATVSPPTPVSKVVWTPEVLQILARGNTERGRAKVLEVCVACHGEQGVSVVPDYPNLNGQSGAAIYKELGDPNRNIPPCAACHRPGSGGPIETPILSEQGRDYLAQQLRMYASGERRNDVYARMRVIAAKLTPGEIDGLSRYYSAGFR